MIIATLIEGPTPPLKHQFVGVFTAMFAKHLNARIKVGTVFFNMMMPCQEISPTFILGKKSHKEFRNFLVAF